MPSKKTALLVIDMLNTLDFPQGKELLRAAVPAAKKIAKLQERFRARRWPVIYVNDNFGHWQSDWRQVFSICAQSRGAPLARILPPQAGDYFVLKPRHSGFYGTNLNLLLQELKVRKLVISGIAGNICVLFTAHEAHMRGYEVVVPSDCIASNKQADTRFTLRQLRTALGLKVSGSSRL